MKDIVFGEMIKEGLSYKKRETFEIYEFDFDVEIEVELEISDIQRNAYEKYKENHLSYETEILQSIYEYYKDIYDDIEKIMPIPEEYHKNNVKKEDMCDLFDFSVLYFGKNGSFGWICTCGWDDDGIAFLLSEEKVRILSPSQLRDYRKIDDPVFGEMIYDAGWEKREKKSLYGKEKLIRIATCDYEDGITDVHRASYKKYQENESRYLEEIPLALLEYYLSMYDEIKEYWRVPRQYTKKNVTKENIMDLIDFKTLYFRYNGMFAWLCECPWEEECGLAFVLSEDKIRVALQTDIL
ncbi:MAG: hypothetical protein Q4B61_04040 [Bacteroidales bacterium]|nr:hypothetical protein [Bacteroidales bacterium]